MAASVGAMAVPTLADVRGAADRIAPHLLETPLHAHAGLASLVGAEVLVKHENHLPTGAFKVRGGVNLVAQLPPALRERGLIAASTGNHGQSLAYAGRLFGARVTMCVPGGANPAKVGAIRALGAEIVEHGRDFDEAREHCEALAAERGLRYVHSGDEPDLIAGVGDAHARGARAGARGRRDRRPDRGRERGGRRLRRGEGAPARLRGDRRPGGGRPRCVPLLARGTPSARTRMATAAEGLATRVGFALPQAILWEQLDDFVLVSEDELQRAARLMIEHTRNLVELAGAAPLAGALRLRERLAGQRVVLVCSGGNVTPEQLTTILASG